MLDIHCHILPGVDDGSSSEEESLAMLSAAKACGIDKMICTPHYMDESFDPEAIDEAFKWFEAEARKAGVTACLGYEIYWNKVGMLGVDAVANHMLDGSDYALIEFSSGANIGQFEERMLWKIKGRGITPIIAHPERYICLQENYDLIYDLRNAGCLMQMSANVANSSMFSARRKTAKYMLKNGLYDFMASDAHTPKDYEDFKKALKMASGVVASQIDFVPEPRPERPGTVGDVLAEPTPAEADHKPG